MPLRVPVAALALAVTVAAGCGGEPSEEERRDELVRELTEDLKSETDGALDDEAATCVAEHLVDDIGPDAFADVVTEAREGGNDSLRQQVVDAFGDCDALDPLLEE